MPTLWLAPGVVGDPRGLFRFDPLTDILLPVGPVVGGPGEVSGGRVERVGVGGLEHAPARGLGLTEAMDRLRWAAGRGLSCVVAVRGPAAEQAGTIVTRLCRSFEADAVAAVEVDLRGADDQTTLKVLARVRESAPRDLLLLARLSALQPDLVAAARGAVAGGAGAVVVCGSVRLGPELWWSGPSTAAATRAGLRLLAEAGADQRWPAVPLVAAGGVHDVPSARAALADGAAAVMLGTALWADPTLLQQLRTDLEESP